MISRDWGEMERDKYRVNFRIVNQEFHVLGIKENKKMGIVGFGKDERKTLCMFFNRINYSCSTNKNKT